MVIIVGTGAGGGILARELSKNGVDVTILEKGPYIESKDAFNYYDAYSEDINHDMYWWCNNCLYGKYGKGS